MYELDTDTHCEFSVDTMHDDPLQAFGVCGVGVIELYIVMVLSVTARTEGEGG
jgi:hypothetical protein